MASPSKAFISWAAGILATVISSVLIYYLTTPKPTPPPQASIQIEGRVIDLSTNSLIKDALVTLQAGKYLGSQKTDTAGRYGFDVALPENTEATVEIVVAGYTPYSVNTTLRRLSETEDNDLLHEAVGGGNPPTNNVPSAAPNPGAQQGGAAGGGALIGGLSGGGKGAAIGAAAGAGAHPNLAAIVGHASPSAKLSLPSASQIQSPTTPKTVVVLPPYVRRQDFKKIGP